MRWRRYTGQIVVGSALAAVVTVMLLQNPVELSGTAEGRSRLLDAEIDTVFSGSLRATPAGGLVVLKIRNVGIDAFEVSDRQVSVSVRVGTAPTAGTLTLLTAGGHELLPGGSARFTYRWTPTVREVALAAGVTIVGSVSVAGDANRANDTRTVRIAPG